MHEKIFFPFHDSKGKRKSLYTKNYSPNEKTK